MERIQKKIEELKEFGIKSKIVTNDDMKSKNAGSNGDELKMN